MPAGVSVGVGVGVTVGDGRWVAVGVGEGGTGVQVGVETVAVGDCRGVGAAVDRSSKEQLASSGAKDRMRMT
jgi:hypothetical protein